MKVSAFLLPVWLAAGGTGLASAQAQSSLQTAGGVATGTGGTATYTIGQLTTQVASGPGGTVSPGVQQPLEISVVTATNQTDAVLECTTYPNPTVNAFALRVDAQLIRNLTWRLQDANGRELLSENVKDPLTSISLANYPAGLYLLTVRNRTAALKTFRIIKH